MTYGPTRLPRDLHPGAWWLWALALATVASRTTNPLLLALVLAGTSYVVVRRRGDAPWARGFRYYLIIAVVVVAIRVIFRVFLGGAGGSHLLVTLPSVHLPSAAGLTLGGPVTAESVLAAAYDGLRLATMLVCLGAANALANPKRLLRLLPGALYEVGVAVVVALSVAPQLIESVLRVRRARLLRGGATKGRRAISGVLLPVLEDALDRSLMLAAAMDSRGYGRRAPSRPGVRARSGTLVIAGLIGICVGLYGLLGSDAASRRIGVVGFGCGAVLAIIGMVVGGRAVQRTRYRPDPWSATEWAVAGSGFLAMIVFLGVGIDPRELYPSLSPLTWPSLPLVPALAVLLTAAPAWIAPVPMSQPRRADVGVETQRERVAA
jgi:energy-coupling factor transport system permease protein